uniref:N-acetyltransferase domain-containing protein n=1 Tax=Anopheles epiroticus TaxID=199890 RepID=A0A182PYS2_9DIPT
MDSVNEPLRPASIEEIEQLIRIYEQNIPQTLQYVLILQNVLRISTTIHGDELEEASHRVRKTVYIPKDGNFHKFATFLAISCDEDLYIMAHSLQSPPDELTGAIKRTSYIKWNLKPVFVIGGAKETWDQINQMAIMFNLTIDTEDFINYWMSQEEASKLTIVIPNDVQLKQLEKQHGKQLNEWWPYSYKTSQRYIESAIQYNGGLGFFDKITDNLVACVFKNDLDGIAHLYTVPERTNKGYGSTLAKAMSRFIAIEHKQQVQTFISPNNKKSIRLFEKLGFSAINRIQWLVMN